MTEPKEDELIDPTKQEDGELPDPATGNDDADDTEEPADTGAVEPEEE